MLEIIKMEKEKMEKNCLRLLGIFILFFVIIINTASADIGDYGKLIS